MVQENVSNKILPPLCRIRAAYGIPDDVITIPFGTDPTCTTDTTGCFSVTCDLSEMYRSDILTAGTYKAFAAYANYIQDPDYNPVTQQCAPGGEPCSDLFMGAVKSIAPINVTIQGAAVTKKHATVTYEPAQWNEQCISDGTSISAHISNIQDHNVSDVDTSTIRLNGTVPIINYSIANDILTVQFKASDAVDSLGTAYNGTAYPTVQGKAGSDFFHARSSVEIKATYCEGVCVVEPNGGEIIPSGGNWAICWEAPNNAEKFDLKYSLNNGKSWNFIKSVTGLHCTHWEEVPVVTVNKKKCLMKVIAYDSLGTQVGSDISDKPFSIEVLRLISPNGGETLQSGSTWTIKWTTHKTINPVAKTILKYTTDGTTYKPIETLSGNPESYLWTVPNVSSTKCKVKIILKDASGAKVGTDTSDGLFTIKP
jgi:hypothetical protein